MGSHVAERLRADGAEVRALQRAGSDTTFLESLGCRIVTGDLIDEQSSWAEAIRGCPSVIHAAALVYTGDAWPVVRAVNVDGTRRLARAARDAGVGRFVFLSSVAAYGGRPGPIGEGDPLDAPLGPADHYARSKRQAELGLRDVGASGTMGVTVLRPAVIFGERDRQFTLVLARLATLPTIPLLGRGDVALPVVYAANVASAIVRAIRARAVGTFNLAEDEPTTQAELVLGLARELGRDPAVVRLPGALVRGAARGAEALGLRPPGAPELSPVRAARLWTLGNPYVTRDVRRVLGWTPTVDRDAALRRTARWLIDAGHVRGPRAASTPPA